MPTLFDIAALFGIYHSSVLLLVENCRRTSFSIQAKYIRGRKNGNVLEVVVKVICLCFILGHLIAADFVMDSFNAYSYHQMRCVAMWLFEPRAEATRVYIDAPVYSDIY